MDPERPVEHLLGLVIKPFAAVQPDKRIGCRSREADFGRMYITISDNKYEGSSSGPVVETQEAFSDVLPFPNLFNKLKKAFDPEMTRQKCIDLIMDIEFDRPVVTPVGNGAGVTPPSEGWVNSFVRDNMAKFLKIVRKRGGKVEEY
ncbi:hypothetical protein FOZ62_027272 [Perkinsus olseni]|uniref:Uncharacterized protein n=1 Tax=Perkinsus olseni TaxID=32597 RepID=A0A7J6UHX6_PEROL|nr:hypothetical protein FOZ62_027272 [Perkinsus olseni]